MIRRLATGVALATGLALSLTGCLGGAGDRVGEAGEKLKPTAAQVLGKTAERAARLGSFKAEVSTQMNGSSQGETLMSGQVQFRTKPDLAFNMKFDHMSVGGRSMPITRQVLIDRGMYMKIPALGRLPGVSSAKTWIKMPLDELGRRSSLHIAPIVHQSQLMDAVQNTTLLMASKDVREVGKETVDGVETTRYTGTYRIQDATAKLPPDQRERHRQSAAQLGLDAYGFDLWVDGEHLPRKVAVEAHTATGVLNTIVRYRDFGEPVQVKAPPANQVSDPIDLLEGIGGGLPRI